LKAGAIENHRGREKGSLIYPVYSRRSKGLSIGINLFPDKKTCNYNCPYCEVFPFPERAAFSSVQADADLREAVKTALEEKIPIMDLCFSGNGEPTMSADFEQMLERTINIRDELVSGTQVVLITNGTGLLKNKIFDLLSKKANEGLCIWLKVDAGTEEWFKKINSPCGIEFGKLNERVKEFSLKAPFTVQTMVCKINGLPPPANEEEAWSNLVTGFAAAGNLKSVQIYGKARSGPSDPAAQQAEPELLENRARALKKALEKTAPNLPVEIFN